MLDRPQVGPQMDGLLDIVWQAGGTDLLLTAGAPPQMRVHGELRSVPGHPRLTARDTRESKPVDPWGPCPTTAPFGACTPAAHAGIATLTSNTIFDPGDGMQLIGFQVKNAAGGPTRTVRLCVQYDSASKYQ